MISKSSRGTLFGRMARDVRAMSVCYVSSGSQLLWIALVLVATVVTLQARGPWNMKLLRQAPEHTWGARTGLVQEVYYEGEKLGGKPTRIFAYVGRPSTPSSKPLPAMVLVHGGGGKAFADWATHWAQRGYVAIAMDLAGKGPSGRLPDGGPDQDDKTKFREFTRTEVGEMWSYHAVAAVIRAHSLLASMPEVDAKRIGLTGISWGGYLTCIVAGVDDRFKVAVPVYGCGYLGENSVWTKHALAAMQPQSRELWLELFDPSAYLEDVECPILFLNGSNDFAYPLDSYQKSYRLVRERLRNVSVVVRLPHGHIWSFQEVDRFIDAALIGTTPLPRLGTMKLKAGAASARVNSPTAITNAQLHFTTDSGEWQKRQWQSVAAQLEGRSVGAAIPTNRPLTFYLSVQDERGLRISTEHVEQPVPDSRLTRK